MNVISPLDSFFLEKILTVGQFSENLIIFIKYIALIVMYEFINSTINSVLTLVNNAVVFVDDATAEVLHWCNGLSKLLDAGALAIRDIKHAKV